MYPVCALTPFSIYYYAEILTEKVAHLLPYFQWNRINKSETFELKLQNYNA